MSHNGWRRAEIQINGVVIVKSGKWKDKSRVTFGIILFGSADIVVLTHTLN